MKNYVEQKLTEFKIWLQNSNYRTAVFLRPQNVLETNFHTDRLSPHCDHVLLPCLF